jgi:hypothetical protein
MSTPVEYYADGHAFTKNIGLEKRGRVRGSVLKKLLQLPVDRVLTYKDRERLRHKLGMDSFQDCDIETILHGIQLSKAIMKGDTKAYKTIIDFAYPPHKQEVDHTITWEQAAEDLMGAAQELTNAKRRSTTVNYEAKTVKKPRNSTGTPDISQLPDPFEGERD